MTWRSDITAHLRFYLAEMFQIFLEELIHFHVVKKIPTLLKLEAPSLSYPAVGPESQPIKFSSHVYIQFL
jgi:hypothetical protein